MNSIGDMSDGNVIFQFVAEQLCPHRTRHFGMERRNCIGSPRESQREHRHTEEFVRVAGILATESQEAFLREPQRLAKRPNVFLDQTCIETIMPGRHGSVRGEDHLARNSRHRCVKCNAFVLHPHVNRFQHREGTVAFVQVKHTRRDPKSFEGPKSTDP